MKTINLNSTIYDLCEKYPEIIEIMKNVGFKEITNPIAMKTAGKIMTIPKGCQMRGIDLEEVKKALKENGFDLIGGF